MQGIGGNGGHENQVCNDVKTSKDNERTSKEHGAEVHEGRAIVEAIARHGSTLKGHGKTIEGCDIENQKRT